MHWKATLSVKCGVTISQHILCVAMIAMFSVGCASTYILKTDDGSPRVPQGNPPSNDDLDCLVRSNSTAPIDGECTAEGSSLAAEPFLTDAEFHLFERAVDFPNERSPLLSHVLTDHYNFYSPNSLALLGGGLAIGGAMANSSIDRKLQRRLQTNVLGATSDDWFQSIHAGKELGNGLYTLPLFAGGWAVGEAFPESESAQFVGTWGERSIRGFAVGTPPLIGLQLLTGGSRPDEDSRGSHWQPFVDNNGISGHSFMGALPFITAAKMTDSPGMKASWYAMSILAPLSRANDNAHYPSQVALGWWTAYLAASAVAATDSRDARWRFCPYTTNDSTGVVGEYKY